MSDNKKVDELEESVTDEISKATESIFDDGEYDEDSGGNFLGLEGDGDIFWAIQSFFWGIIKIVVIFGIIGVLLWVIWRPEPLELNFKNPLQTEEKSFKKNISEKKSQKNSQNNQESEKEKTGFMKMIGGIKNLFDSKPEDEILKKNTNQNNYQNTNTKNNSLEKNDSQGNIYSGLKDISLKNISIEKMAFTLEKRRFDYQEDIFFKSIVWLRKAKNLGEISGRILRINSPSVRGKKIEASLKEADILFKESRFLQKQLQGEINELLILGNNANETVGKIEEKISDALKKFNPTEIATLLQQKITVQKKAVEYLSEAKLRNTLIQNIQTFDGLLRKKSIPLLMPARLVPATNK